MVVYIIHFEFGIAILCVGGHAFDHTPMIGDLFSLLSHYLYIFSIIRFDQVQVLGTVIQQLSRHIA